MYYLRAVGACAEGILLLIGADWQLRQFYEALLMTQPPRGGKWPSPQGRVYAVLQLTYKAGLSPCSNY